MHLESPSAHEFREMVDKALFVGISSFTGLQSTEAIHTARMIKNINPDIPIVWGGYHVSLWQKLAENSDLVDYAITGMGESSILSLAKRLKNDKYPDSKIICGTLENEIPSPAMQLINLENYICPTLIGDRVANVHTSYGCPHSCSFCAVKDCFNRKWIAKPPEQVLEEIRYLVSNHKIDGLEFSDNAPFIEQDRMLNIADGMLKNNININWMSMARVDELLNLDDSKWEVLAASGFRRVFVGIESGDDTVLRGISKNENTNQFIEFAQKCAKHGIIPDYSITLGYPLDPTDEIKSSFNLIRQLKKITPSGTVMFYRYTPYNPLDRFAAHVKFPTTWEHWAEPPWDTHSLTGSNSKWLTSEHQKSIHDFQVTMTCAHHREEGVFPSGGKYNLLTNMMIPLAKYRWSKERYSNPIELRILRRLFLELSRGGQKGTLAT